MKCSGCGSDHVNLDETWSSKGSLTRGTWAPYRCNLYEGFQVEGYCASCRANNSRNAFAWTPVQQVSPHHQIWNKIIKKNVPTRTCTKENYGRTGMVHTKLPGHYLGVNQTWAKQPRYTSG